MSRFVVVSNQDSRIDYQGDWSLTDSSNFRNIGTLGPPLENSLHTTTTNNSFSFSFSGSYIAVLGTAASADQLPHVQCFLDGVSFAASLGGPENNIHICSTTSADEQHELTVNVTTQGTPFYLDNLQYQPSADVPLDNATIIISSGDPSITFSIGWEMVNGFPQNMTQTTNAFANITFIGNQLGWFGTFLEGKPQIPSPAEYSVDGAQPISFTLQLPPGKSNSTNIFDIPFFTTDVLQQGPHTITVRYLGNDSTIPLTLNNLLITNASNPLSDPSSSPSSNPSGTKTSNNPSPSPTSQSSRLARGSSAGAIAGGVVGGVVGFLLLILIFFFIRKYYIRKKPDVDSYTAVTPFEVPDQPLPTRQVTPYHTTKPSIASGATVPTTDDTRRIPGESTLPSTSSATAPSHSRTSSTPLDSIPSKGRSRTTGSISEQRNSTGRGPLPQLPLHVRHEDSGLRIPLSADNMIELPPNYTIN